MDEKERLRMAIISGASHAMKYKERNPASSSEEIIKVVTKESDEILSKIDSDE